MKIFIIAVIIFLSLELLSDILIEIYYRSYFKRIRKLTPEEKREWEKQILEECRHRAYQEQKYEIVDKISETLEEKYND